MAIPRSLPFRHSGRLCSELFVASCAVSSGWLAVAGTPIFTSLLPIVSPFLTPFLPIFTPILTVFPAIFAPFHSGCLSLRLRHREQGSWHGKG